MKKGNLLIIDDEEHLLNVLEFMFLPVAEKVSMTNSGGRAIEILMNDRVDCVLCDINLPRMTGLEILKKIREQGITVPFIFFTAELAQEVILEAAKLGAVDFFHKPHFGRVEKAVSAVLHGEPYSADPRSEFGRARNSL
jgi:DNA-binding NtrC family response regulator